MHAPPASPNQTTLRNFPAPATVAPLDSLSRSQRRELERRQRKMRFVEELKAVGLSQVRAAKVARINYTTLWRYQRGKLIPQWHRSGRKSALAKFDPPAALLSAVRRLQISGHSNEHAWRMAAEFKICPPELAKYIRAARSAPWSLLEATRLKRRTLSVIKDARIFYALVELKGTLSP